MVHIRLLNPPVENPPWQLHGNLYISMKVSRAWKKLSLSQIWQDLSGQVLYVCVYA